MEQLYNKTPINQKQRNIIVADSDEQKAEFAACYMGYILAKSSRRHGNKMATIAIESNKSCTGQAAKCHPQGSAEEKAENPRLGSYPFDTKKNFKI